MIMLSHSTSLFALKGKQCNKTKVSLSCCYSLQSDIPYVLVETEALWKPFLRKVQSLILMYFSTAAESYLQFLKSSKYIAFFLTHGNFYVWARLTRMGFKDPEGRKGLISGNQSWRQKCSGGISEHCTFHFICITFL